MKTKLNKKHAEEKIKEFFVNIKNRTPEEIRKIRKLTMHYKIKLGKLRKLFCKYCYSGKLKIRKITRNRKTVECENCGKMMRWKLR